MKRLFIGLSLAFMVLSCAKKEVVLLNDNIERDGLSTFVTPEMALEEVENFLKEVSIESRAYANKQISSIYSTREMTNTRTGDAQDADPFIYVVNFEGNQGYALVSGDTRMQPILAVTDTGSLPQGTVIDNPGMIMMLSNIETDYRMALGLPVEDVDGNIVNPIGTAADGSYIYPDMDVEDTEQTRSTTTTYEYGPWDDYIYRGTQIGCEWGQSSLPFNLHTYAPDGQRAPAGCVPVAVAQIMYYWGLNYTYDGYYFNWGEMSKPEALYDNTSLGYQMIAELMLKLGLPENLDVDYTATKSTAKNANIARTFENFGYTSGGSIESYNFDDIYNVIASRPVYVSGWAKKKVTKKIILGITIDTTIKYDESHAWVIDQVLTRGRNQYTYIDGVKQQGFIKVYEKLVHCNMGLGGEYNGYYYSKQFDVNEVPITRKTTTTTSGTSGYYQYDLKMNAGIYL